MGKLPHLLISGLLTNDQRKELLWRALNASTSGCTRDTDPIGAEILLSEKPEHPLHQAGWNTQDDNRRILSAVEFLFLRKIILKLTMSYRVGF